jgi:hypothetical protein
MISPSLGIDAAGTILSTSATPKGHHRDTVAAMVDGPRSREVTGGQAQAGKEQRAARCRHVGLPRRRTENDCPVR